MRAWGIGGDVAAGRDGGHGGRDGSGPAGAEASRTGRNDAVTVTGVLEQFVVDHGSGEETSAMPSAPATRPGGSTG